jgi:hypothetical protein
MKTIHQSIKKDLDLSSLSLDLIHDKIFWRQLIIPNIIEWENTSVVIVMLLRSLCR